MNAPGAAGYPAVGGYRFYIILLLGLASFFSFMDRSVLAVLVEPIKHDLHISDTQVGILAGFSFALFYASFGLPLARLADRRSRVGIMTVSIAVWSVVTAASGLVANFSQLLLARMGVGVGEASCIPCAHSLISDYFPPPERAFALSVFQAAGIAGSTAGLAGAGYVAQIYGWRWAFVAVGLPGLLVAALTWFTMREPRRGVYTIPAQPVTGTDHWWSDLKLLAGQRTYRHLVLGLGATAFTTQGLTIWTPTFFVRLHHLSVAASGFWVGASSGIGSVVGLVAGGAYAIVLVRRDRRWECWLPAASLVAALPLYLIAFTVSSTSLALAANFAASFAASFGYGMGLASFHGVTPAHLRGLAASIVMFATSIIGLGAGPFAIGFLSDRFGGGEGLRDALVISLLFKGWATFHFLRAATTIREDLIS